jgi:hypothetical protein
VCLEEFFFPLKMEILTVMSCIKDNKDQKHKTAESLVSARLNIKSLMPQEGHEVCLPVVNMVGFPASWYETFHQSALKYLLKLLPKDDIVCFCSKSHELWI